MKAEALRRGSSRDITAAYEAHSPFALRLAYLLTGDEQVAQDVVQDAFVRIFSRLLFKVPPNDFQNYLRRTVVNLCKDHWRRKGVARSIRLFEREDKVDPPEIETRDELWTALKDLPQRQRTALVLRYFEDLSEQQTAEILGCSVGAVKALTTRGTQAMRRRLEETR
jgi:RNA polymerase sigma-70 factor (sigma-E family)